MLKNKIGSTTQNIQTTKCLVLKISIIVIYYCYYCYYYSVVIITILLVNKTTIYKHYADRHLNIHNHLGASDGCSSDE